MQLFITRKSKWRMSPKDASVLSAASTQGQVNIPTTVNSFLWPHATVSKLNLILLLPYDLQYLLAETSHTYTWQESSLRLYLCCSQESGVVLIISIRRNVNRYLNVKSEIIWSSRGNWRGDVNTRKVELTVVCIFTVCHLLENKQKDCFPFWDSFLSFNHVLIFVGSREVYTHKWRYPR